MKIEQPLIFTRISAVKGLGRLFNCFCAAVLAFSATTSADIPDRPSGRFGGVYKIASSSDPIFPATAKREYFLDFGDGVQAGRSSGNVAVSVRENPNVKVRIMAWQYFPDQGKILIGNPFAEGSNRAVAKGMWQLKPVFNGVVFERGSYRVVLQTVDPADY
jgi:hypothetical protein